MTSKENATGQTVYEQLQEAILKKIYPDLNISEAIYKYRCVNDVKYSNEGRSVYVFSLAIVLSVLGDRFIYKQGSLVAMIVYDEPIEGEKCYFVEIPRKLLNEDNSDCMLSDQSPETIKSIREIVCK